MSTWSGHSLPALPWTPNSTAIAAVVSCAASCRVALPISHGAPKGDVLNSLRRDAVREEFGWSWAAYEEHAWGRDEYLPISQSGHDWVGGGIGLTILDSIDTLHLLGFDAELQRATEWVETSLSFDRGSPVSTFELSIRGLGGLLSAHAMTGREIFAKRALQLGKRLLGAFETPSGLPTTKVDLRAGAVQDLEPFVLAEMGTLSLEFTHLSAISGDPRFRRAVERVSMHLARQAHHSQPNAHLLPIYLDGDGDALNWFGQPMSKVSLGAGGDSYYEYLLKSWLQSNRTDERQWKRYEGAVEAIRRRLLR